MNVWKFSKYLPILSLGAVSASATAEENIQIRTYGSVGFSRLMSAKSAEVDVITDAATLALGKVTPEFTSFDGVNKGGSWRRNTHFGLNISGALSSDLSYSFGLLAESLSLENGPSQDRGPYPLRSTVASLNYEGIKNLSIQFGHLPAPFWLISEEKYVGYTYPWMRPPYELYKIPSLTENLEGIRATYRINIGELTLKPSVLMGDFPITGAKGRDGFYKAGGFNLNVEYDWLTVQMNILRARAEINDAISAGTVTVPTSSGGTATVQALSVATNRSNNGQFNTIGIRATPGDFFIMAEAAEVVQEHYKVAGAYAPFEGIGSHPRAFYATLGYNIGKFMPRVTYSKIKDEFINKKDWVTKPTIDGAVAAGFITQEYADRLEKAILRNYAWNASNTIQFGVNYQLSTKSILKVEYQTTKADDSAFNGDFGMPPGGEASIAQAGIDFVL